MSDDLVKQLMERAKIAREEGDMTAKCDADYFEKSADRITALEAENADLKQSVIAFLAPWAVTYAQGLGLPKGSLHPDHYDMLEKCGGRMVSFTRAPLPQLENGATRYNIAAMKVDPVSLEAAIGGDYASLHFAFEWWKTPQGRSHWAQQFWGLKPLDIAALREILRQYEESLT